MTQPFIRGSTVIFTATFKDVDGNVVSPSGATLTVEYTDKCGSGCQSESIAMSNDGDEWTSSWDSRNAAPGAVSAHARTDGDIPIYSVDLDFVVRANAANKKANAS